MITSFVISSLPVVSKFAALVVVSISLALPVRPAGPSPSVLNCSLAPALSLPHMHLTPYAHEYLLQGLLVRSGCGTRRRVTSESCLSELVQLHGSFRAQPHRCSSQPHPTQRAAPASTSCLSAISCHCVFSTWDAWLLAVLPLAHFTLLSPSTSVFPFVPPHNKPRMAF